MRALAGDGGLSVVSASLLVFGALIVGWGMLLVTATLVVRRVYRRFRRWFGWHRGAAAVQSRPMRPGPARDVARLRRDLREEVEAADVMLSRAKNGRLFVADARALVDDLKIQAAAMDADLASIQAYADTSQQRPALDVLAPQVARLIQTSYLARQTMLQTAVADRERHVTDLSEHVERQAAALKIYRQTSNGLDLDDPDGYPAATSGSPAPDPAPTRSYSPGTSSPSVGSATLG